MAQSDLVAMDLRAFTAQKEGCIFELGALIDEVPLQRVVLLIDQTTATNDHLKIGDTVTMTFDVTGDQPFTIGGIYEDNRLLGHYTVANATIAANSNVVRDAVILASTSSVTPAIQKGLVQALAGFPDLKR